MASGSLRNANVSYDGAYSRTINEGPEEGRKETALVVQSIITQVQVSIRNYELRYRFLKSTDSNSFRDHLCWETRSQAHHLSRLAALATRHSLPKMSPPAEPVPLLAYVEYLCNFVGLWLSAILDLGYCGSYLVLLSSI
jgi:hypothetical protein